MTYIWSVRAIDPWPLGDHAHTKMAPDPGQKWRHMENKALFDAVLACDERALQKLLTDGASPDGHKTKEVMFALKTNSARRHFHTLHNCGAVNIPEPC